LELTLKEVIETAEVNLAVNKNNMFTSNLDTDLQTRFDGLPDSCRVSLWAIVIQFGNLKK
jgi:hypothetical protein